MANRANVPPAVVPDFSFRSRDAFKAETITRRAAQLRHAGSMLLLLAPVRALRAVMYASLVASVVYALSVCIGVFNGFALPTTAIFVWWPAARILGQYEFYLEHFILFAAGVAWLCWWITPQESKEYQYGKLEREVLVLGPLILIAIFIFSISGWWVGLARPGDLQASSIVGLIPFSDAGGYFAAAHDQIRDGFWNSFSLRRPFGAAGRSLLLAIGGLSYSTMLLVQGVLCGLSVWTAGRLVLLWRGPLACLAFLALSFMIFRSFLATALTEPIGLIWAFFASACFAQAIRFRSLGFAILGLCLVAMALMTRLGAMFLLPAVALWIVYNFASGLKAVSRLSAVLLLVIVGVFSVNSALQRVYGEGADLTGSNFAYSLCGLSIGESWGECLTRYSDDLTRLAGNERASADFLYAKAIENIKANPKIITTRLLDGGVAFIQSLRPKLLNGYLEVTPSRWIPTGWFLIAAALGLAVSGLLRPSQMEWSFWGLVLIGSFVSAMFVFFDDGSRVMSVSYPFIAMFLSSGLATRWTLEPEKIPPRSGLVPGWSAVVVVLMAFLIVPWAMHANAPGALGADRSSPSEQIVFAGPRMTGVLVVADDQPLPASVPSIYFSDFSKVIEQSNVEIYQPLVKPQHPAVPFAFVVAPRRERGLQSVNQLIAPPEMLLRKDVRSWRLTTTEWASKPGNSIYWLLVTKAEVFD